MSLCQFVPILWIWHKPHHSQEHYNIGLALSNGLGTVYQLQLMTYCMHALIIPWEVHAILDHVYACFHIIEHAQAPEILPLSLPKYFEWLIYTPTTHKVHHARNASLAHKNYGVIFTVFDRAFGTHADGNGERLHFGLFRAEASKDPTCTEIYDHSKLFAAAMRADGLWNKVKTLLVFPDGNELELTDDQEILAAESERRQQWPVSKEVVNLLPAGYKHCGQWVQNGLLVYAFVTLTNPENGKVVWLLYCMACIIIICACVDQKITRVAWIEVCKNALVLGFYMNATTRHPFELCFGSWPLLPALMSTTIGSLMLWVGFLLYEYKLCAHSKARAKGE